MDLHISKKRDHDTIRSGRQKFEQEFGAWYGANDASATAGFFAICLLLHGRGSLFQAGTVFFASFCIIHTLFADSHPTLFILHAHACIVV